MHSKLVALREGRCGEILDKMYFVWYTLVRPKLFYILGFLSAGLSLYLVLGELIILFQLKFSILTLLPSTPLGQTLADLLSLLLLAYLCLCVNLGLFSIKFTAYYELHANQQTDAFSLLYSAGFLTKLAAPLCFNYLLILQAKNTAFS